MRTFLFVLYLINCCCAKSTTVGRLADIGQFINPAMAFGLTVIKEDEEGAFQCLYSVLLNMTLTAGIKHGVNKIHKGDEPMNRRPNGRPYNFPSGHTSSASVGANFILFRYGIEYAALPYIMTAITAAGRVQNRRHTGAGVISGFLVGFLSAFIFTKKFQEKNKSLSIASITSKEFNGLKIVYRF
ncbi:phosphatase PAP2 family protein [Candidatus Odyssella acanthamoebae]|uniref:phosphatase PAP2 family protein n=1 Tax=Candidatus Odyssella acanthamoebae TaxID=91604 RepID=UPI00068FBDA9|nr:phosphatase PAP2 family protein [Candidatus Paracaedibacter acanthamoebae]